MRGLSDDVIKQMLTLRAEGKNLTDIARILGLSVTTVQRHCANSKLAQSDCIVTTIEENTPKKSECNGSVIQGVIVGRQHNQYNLVTKFVPDYNIEVASTPICATYEFGPVRYTVDNRDQTIELLNPEVFMGPAVLKDIDNMCEYAKAVVGICETIKKHGKVKVWEGNYKK